MDRHRGDLGRDPLVAMAAGGLQIGGEDRRCRVPGVQDEMGAVAGGAVGDRLVAGLALQAVIGVDEGLQPPGGQVVLLVQGRRLVAGRAGRLGQPVGADRGARIRDGQDAVLAVAAGADRRVDLAASRQLAVDALPVVLLDRGVALAAGPRDVEVVDRRLGVDRREDLVRRAPGGVAVVAAGRLREAAGLMGHPMWHQELQM